MANTNKPYPASQGRSRTYDAPDPHANTVRNTNKLLRQYLPKGTNLATFTQADLDAIAAKLNNQPRKCLDFRTPAQAVALTG